MATKLFERMILSYKKCLTKEVRSCNLVFGLILIFFVTFSSVFDLFVCLLNLFWVELNTALSKGWTVGHSIVQWLDSNKYYVQ